MGNYLYFRLTQIGAQDEKNITIWHSWRHYPKPIGWASCCNNGWGDGWVDGMMPPFLIPVIQKYLAGKAISWAAGKVAKQFTHGAKAMKGKRTLLFNIAALVAGLLAYKGFDVDPETLVTIVLAVVPVGNAVLRFLTTTPVFEKD